jgi:Sulfatase/Secretion system C-terminal sorting domain
LDSLAKYAPLEKFMIIFTSDNGKLIGEHQLSGKRWPYNESMRVPLFIRYPKWFTPGSLITSENALNLDLAPTILDAAGVTATYNMQGFSLRNLYDGTKHRKLFYYEGIEVIGTSPDFRTVRSMQYSYTKYACDSVVEQFFDLSTDSLELTNQVYNAVYQSKLNEYRNKLNIFAIDLNDTVPLGLGSCYEILPELERESELTTAKDLFLSPNPAEKEIHLRFALTQSSRVIIKVYGAGGKEIETLLDNELQAGDHFHKINLSHFTKGVYLVKMITDSGIENQKLVVQ